MRRLASALAAVVAFAAAALVLAPPAGATGLPMGQCTTSRNAVVAVNFAGDSDHRWNGPIVRGCGSTPTTGLDLLHDAGFTTAGTQHDGPSFVCRIGSSAFHGGRQYPTPSEDACVNTPSSGNYWSYWHADPGQNSWSYSQLGAYSTHPGPGSVDYWQFGGTNTSGTSGRPAVSPNAVRARNTTAIGSGGSSGASSNSGGSHHVSGHGGGRPRSSTHAGPGRAPSTSAHSSTHSSASASTHRTASPRSGTSSSTGPAPGSSSSSPPRIVNASPAAKDASSGSSSGSALPVIVGVGIAVLVGAAAGVVMLRRRADATADD